MKRILAVILAIAMVLSFAACGSDNSTVPGDGTSSDEASSAPASAGETSSEETSSTLSTNTPLTSKPSTSKPSTSTTSPSKHTHSYSKKVTAATCTAQGYTTYSCSCGHSYTDNYTDPAHKFSNNRCTICNYMDKSYAYSLLINWVKEKGTTSGGYTVVKFNSNSYVYRISYSAQNVSQLTISKDNWVSDGNKDGDVMISLNLSKYWDNYFYGCTVLKTNSDDLEMYGYINASSFTKNSSIKYNSYTGDPSLEYKMLELSRTGICDLIEFLDYVLKTKKIGITIKDLGFTAY